MLNANSFSEFFRILRTRKLYDSQNHQWKDFDGNPTAPPIPKLGDDKMINKTIEERSKL
jgi:hypothetical protein